MKTMPHSLPVEFLFGFVRATPMDMPQNML